MRYRPKSIGALQIVLGSLLDKMRVEADPDTRGVCEERWRASDAGSAARKFSGDNPARSQSRNCCKGQQHRGDSHLAETVDHSPADSPAPPR
jgi:hypothetical protein